MRSFYLGCFCAAVSVAPNVGAQQMEELVVTAQHDLRSIDVVDALSTAPDPAQLLMRAPGANVTSNGPITGIPQYRGLFGPRVAVALDGNGLAPAGPNWMDPPLSYAVTAQLESLEVYRGIAPVSVAQETLGGAIDARTRYLGFSADDTPDMDGRFLVSADSVRGGYQVDADVQWASEQHRFRAAAMRQSAGDAEFPGGEILPSRYKRTRFDVGYGFRIGDHSVQIDVGRNETGASGTPALPMDIDYFDGDLASLTYRYQPLNGLQVEASLFSRDLVHGMSNYGLRQPPASASRWRRNTASAESQGFRFQLTQGSAGGEWRAGVDGFAERHRSDIDNPNAPMFFVVNFNDAERSVAGVFLERAQALGDDWDLELGVRVNHVVSDAGEVNGTPAMMMPPAQTLRDAFNNASRRRADTNVDLFAKLNYRVSDSLGIYAGVAQKTRSASYQERFLWLPLEATAGLADGQLYLGNLELAPESATQVEGGFDLQAKTLSLRPRVFYYRIDDYIQGTPVVSASPGAAFVAMMNRQNATSRGVPLQFNNVAAELYGLDLDWSLQLSQQWRLGGLLNVVSGKRRDIDDNLYRIAPPNATVQLEYAAGGLTALAEMVAYARQSDVSATNREQSTPGYSVFNLRGSWQLNGALQLSLGVENLFDRRYSAHLGGYNRAANPDVPLFGRLPALGRNLFARVMYTL